MLWKIAIPIVIGLAVVVWLFSREFSIDALREISITPVTIAAIAAALVASGNAGFRHGMAFQKPDRPRAKVERDMAHYFYVSSLRLLPRRPVGGSALSMIFLKREGINIGRATTLTMTILFLDELFLLFSVR